MNAPLADLQRFVADIKPHLLERCIRAGQRAAWRSWRDDANGMQARFDAALQKKYPFSSRMPSRQRSVTPKYVFTGAFREALRRRQPKKAADATAIVTTFSIFGGVLNLLGADKQRGFTRTTTVTARQTVQVPPYSRVRNGTTEQVRGYTQQVTRTQRTYTRSTKTYAEEWAYQPFEIIDVQRRSEMEITARFRRSMLTKNGTLREGVRAAGREAA